MMLNSKGTFLILSLLGSYIVDFQPVSGGTYTFTSIRQLLGVSVSQCAQMCAEEQGTNCHGFYFCQKVSACHLTSVQPGQPQVQVDHSSQAIFCNYYTSKYNLYRPEFLKGTLHLIVCISSFAHS